MPHEQRNVTMPWWDSHQGIVMGRAEKSLCGFLNFPDEGLYPLSKSAQVIHRESGQNRWLHLRLRGKQTSHRLLAEISDNDSSHALILRIVDAGDHVVVAQPINYSRHRG